MWWFYLRWGAVLLAGLAIALLGARHHQGLRTISPQQLLDGRPAGTVRVRGMVLPGSLSMGPTPDRASFELGGGGGKVFVRYSGPAPENLRELKTLVVIGTWNPAGNLFEAQDTGLLPNFGFVTAAYVAALVPTALFLFWMERRVAILYREIRDQKVYEPGGQSG